MMMQPEMPITLIAADIKGKSEAEIMELIHLALPQVKGKAWAMKVYNSVSIKKRPHRTCSVQSTPKANWKPRSTEEGLTIARLMKERKGMQSVAEDDEEECVDEFTHKLLLNDIQIKLLRSMGESGNDKGVKLQVASAVKSFACRVLEEAKIAAEEMQLSGKLGMHNTHDAPSWCAGCRGAGIVYSNDANSLLDAAIERVKARFS